MPHSHHGNGRRAPPGPLVAVQPALEAKSPGTSPTPAELNLAAQQPSTESRSAQRLRPGHHVAALLQRISIHPEAQRILGNSCIPVVSLERLDLRSVISLQPVVSMLRLPVQTGPQSGSAQCDLPEPEPEPAETWTGPHSPHRSQEPEQDSGFDCDSDPDHTIILLDAGSDEWDLDQKTETFYLDPDPEQNLVIQLDPELEVEQEGTLQLEDECVQIDDSEEEEEEEEEEDKEEEEEEEEEKEEEGDSVECGPGLGALESEDFCGVCLNGGNLLCCDHCPKVYHLDCHIPPLRDFPLGDWVCSLCRTDLESVKDQDCGENNTLYRLSPVEQRRCEKLTLLLLSHTLSAPFHRPVSKLARNYHQIIRRPVDLSLISRKLDQNKTLHYFTAQQFVDDVMLMFTNCATFNYPDSEVAQAGRILQNFFLSKLKEVFSDRTFPSTNQEPTDRVHLRWTRRKWRKRDRKRKLL